jgi:short subunit dehydrogenase-like uncharacterized protein
VERPEPFKAQASGAIIMKQQIDPDLRRALLAAGFEVRDLPRNPYLGDAVAKAAEQPLATILIRTSARAFRRGLSRTLASKVEKKADFASKAIRGQCASGTESKSTTARSERHCRRYRNIVEK